jgi:hypothetical protein
MRNPFMLAFIQKLARLKKPDSDIMSGIRASILEMAKSSGMETSEAGGAIRVSGSGKSCAIVIQFGGRREFYMTLESLIASGTDFRAIVTSSNVKSMTIGEMKWILVNKYHDMGKWLFVDVESNGQPKTLNFMLYEGAQPAQQPQRPRQEKREPRVRRKMIYGIPGEHKEQD